MATAAWGQPEFPAVAVNKATRELEAALAEPQPDLLECDIEPRPLSHPLRDYHIAISEGPLNYTWQDKPHRLVYDLIAAVRYYAAPQAKQPLTDEQIIELWLPVNRDAPHANNGALQLARAIERTHGIGAKP